MVQQVRFFLVVVAVLVSAARASDDGSQERAKQLEKAKQDLTAERYQLRYKYVAGETVRYKVEHLATVDTRISGNSQQQKSRSVSTKAWQIKEVDEVDTQHRIAFVHMVEDVDMWSHVSGRQELRYNSREDKQPPAEYQHVAKSLQVPLAVVTIDEHGTILKRERQSHHPDLGFGGLVLPLPREEVPLGYTWAVPHELKVKLPDGLHKSIKTRLQYRLEKVQTGVATISVTTQVLTPVHDARIEAQLVQQLSKGEIKFDIDAGRILSKRLDWDENVIGFNGSDSNMKYLARFTEELIKPDVARKPQASESAGG